jgi:hypothetical protein
VEYGLWCALSKFGAHRFFLSLPFLQVHEWQHTQGALPMQPSPVIESSPYNPRLLNGASAATLTRVQLTAVRQEAEGIKTFEFEAPPAMRVATLLGEHRALRCS